METELNTIDENGDLVIILSPSTEPFAPWPTADSAGAKDEDAKDAGTTEASGEASGGASAENEHQETGQGPERSTEPRQYRFLVTSAILRRASPVFNRELDPNSPWKQLAIQPDGFRHKHLEGFDVHAFTHVLNIMHFHNKDLPKKIETEELAKVAVVVDYLQCSEAMAFVSKSWVDERMKFTDKTINRNLVLWLFISTVFSFSRIFRRVWPIIAKNSSGPVDTCGLPIGPIVG